MHRCKVCHLVAILTIFTLQLSRAQTCEPTVLSAIGGRVNDFAAAGTIVYAAMGSAGIDVYDVADPSQPRLIGSVVSDLITHRLALTPGVLVAASSDGDAQCFDISDPTAPRSGGLLNLPVDSVTTVTGHGSHFYIGGLGGGLAVINASEIDTPRFLGLADGSEHVFGADADGGLLATAEGTRGVKVFDLTDPAVPTLLAVVAEQSENVRMRADALYSTKDGRLVTIDLSDPEAPQIVSQYSFGPPETTQDTLFLAGDMLCWFAPRELRWYSLDSPLSPSYLGSVLDWPNSRAVIAAETCVIRAGSDGLMVYELRAPTLAPRMTLSIEGYRPDLWLFGDRLFASGARHRILRLPRYELLYEWDPEGLRFWTDGEYLLTHSVDELLIYDVRDGVEPTLVSAVPTGFSPSSRVHSSGRLAFVTDDDTLATFDWSDPAAPELIAAATLPWLFEAADVEGDLLCGRIPNDSVAILDVSNPANPVHLSSVGGPSYPVNIVRFEGGLLFVQSEGLRIYDVSEPTHPVALGIVFDPEVGFQDMAIRDGLLYLSSQNGVTVWDITDPSAPVETARSETVIDATSLELTPTSVLVSGNPPEGSFRPYLYEVTGVESDGPRKLHSLHSIQVTDDAVFRGDTAYLAGTDAIVAVDLSDPQQPSLLGVLSGRGAIAIEDRGEYLFSLQGNSLRVTKGLTPLSIQTVAVLPDLRVRGWRPRMLQYMEHLYIVSDEGLLIIDATNPESPREVASTYGPSISNAAISGDVLCYLHGLSGYLTFMDLSVPDSPVFLAEFRLPRRGFGLEFDGTNVYSGDEHGNLHVIDASNPSSPVLVTTVESPEYEFHRVMKQGNRLYCTTPKTLSVFDVSRPHEPRFLGATEPLADEIRPFSHRGQLYLGAGLTPAFMAVDPNCTRCSADVNGDGFVDTRDFVEFLNAWATQRSEDCSSGGCSADLDANGVVDSRDFVLFLDAWAQGC